MACTQESSRTRVIARGGGNHHTMAMENKPVIRPTARVLLLDDQDRVLLFCGQDATNPSMRFWFPAGGGIEPGETAEEAARREVLEETGFTDLVLGPHIWNRRHVVNIGGAHLDCREVWFFARVPTFEIDTSGFTELERETVLEHRWWTQDDLDNTTEILTPRDLAALLRDLLVNGTPEMPVTVQI